MNPLVDPPQWWKTLVFGVVPVRTLNHMLKSNVCISKTKYWTLFYIEPNPNDTVQWATRFIEWTPNFGVKLEVDFLSSQCNASYRKMIESCTWLASMNVSSLFSLFTELHKLCLIHTHNSYYIIHVLLFRFRHGALMIWAMVKVKCQFDIH